MTYTISTDNTVPLSLCESNEALSILQGVALVCSTKKGTCPGYREFGIPMKYIGRPIEAAETIAFSEITDALATFEKRATLKDVTITDILNYNKMEVSLEVET